MTRRSAMICVLCRQEVVATRHGLIHRRSTAKANDHKPVVDETVEESAQEARG